MLREALIISSVGLLLTAFAAWMSSLRDQSRQLDTTLEVLLAEGSKVEPDDAEPDLLAALKPDEVLALTPGQIAAICQRLDSVTDWSIHPALRRKPRPRRGDAFDFFADGSGS